MKKIKEVTDEKVTKTMNTELEDELKVKLENLKNCKTRLNGGKYQLGNEIRTIPPIDEEMKDRKRTIRMSEIEIANDGPMHARWQYENHPEWRMLKKEILQQKLDAMKKVLEDVRKQKEKIVEDIPQFKARINEIEKELKKKITDFKE